MHRSRALFSGSDALCHMRWSADFITDTSESEFSAHTGSAGVAARDPGDEVLGRERLDEEVIEHEDVGDWRRLRRGED